MTRRWLAVVLGAFALVAVACGGDDAGHDDQAAPATAAEASEEADDAAASAEGDGDGDRVGDGGLSGIVREPLPQVGNVALPDVTNGGQPFPFRAAPGELLVTYFGYTSCPDVCPTTLADLRTALDGLGADADRIAVAMATVDPERDTVEVLSGYVRSFVPDAHALRSADPAELAAAAEPFGVAYDVSTNEEGDVEVVHSGFLYVVDDQGRLVLTWPFGTEPQAIRADLELLLEEEAT